MRGLALRRESAEPLLIPRCRSVHTFGMRFALDLFWLDEWGRVLRVDSGALSSAPGGHHQPYAAEPETQAGMRVVAPASQHENQFPVISARPVAMD